MAAASKEQKEQQKQRRARRLSAALRDNLKRRKSQTRGRGAADTGRSTETHDSAGIGEDKQTR
jgi:hypothetical protein